MTFNLGRDSVAYDIDEVHWFNVTTARILQMRNKSIEKALQIKATRMLMVDPDMWPDAYLHGEMAMRGAKPFLPTAWAYLNEHPGSVTAAPYCGRGGDVHVFGTDEAGDVRRISSEYADWLNGWVRVTAVGTGLMLIDCDVFRKIEPPWFDDVYSDKTKTRLLLSQDAYFCRRCSQAKVPIYVQFDSWARHRHSMNIEAPGALLHREPSEKWAGPASRVVRPPESAPVPTKPIQAAPTAPVAPVSAESASPSGSFAW